MKKLGLLILSAPLFTGCAAIVSGTGQVVSVETRKGGDAVAGATCRMDNDKGTYYVTTPGTVDIKGAYGDMTVKCEKDGYPTGTSQVKSTTKPIAFGNILFGGIIGAAIDIGTGAAYEYPASFTVLLDPASLTTPQSQGDTQSKVAAADTGGAGNPKNVSGQPK